MTMELIERVTLASPAATVEFSGIADTYATLLVQYLAGSDDTSDDRDELAMQVGNGTVDTGSNYAYELRFDGSGSNDLHSASATEMWMAQIPAALGNTEALGTGEIWLPNYNSTATFWKSLLGEGGYATGTDRAACLAVGRWDTIASAIDIIRFTAKDGTNLVAGSRFDLYGLS